MSLQYRSLLALVLSPYLVIAVSGYATEAQVGGGPAGDMATADEVRPLGVKALAALVDAGVVVREADCLRCIHDIADDERAVRRSESSFEIGDYPRHGTVSMRVGQPPGPIAVFRYSDNAPPRQATRDECAAMLEPCRARAWTAAQSVRASIGGEGEYVLYSTHLESSPAALVFTYRRLSDEVLVNDWLRISIGLFRELRGTVTSFEWSLYPIAERPLVRLTRKQAEEAAMPQLTGARLPSDDKLEMMVSRSRGISAVVWHFTNLTARPASEPWAAAHVDLLHTYVDATSGAVLTRDVAPASVTDLVSHADLLHGLGLRSRGPNSSDRCPAWTPEGSVLFVASRLHIGLGEVPDRRWSGYVRSSALFIQLGDETRLLLPALDSAPGSASVVVGSEVLTLMPPSLINLSLSTGTWAMQDGGQRPFGEPSGSLWEHVFCFSANRSHGDTDIFVAEVSGREVRPLDQRRVVHLAGPDLHPVFSPDGSKVFFDHRVRQEDGSEASSIRVARSDVPYWDAPDPEIVLDQVPPIDGLSAFPDGRLLVSHAEGIGVLEPEAHQLTSLELGELHDPDLPNGQPLEVRDPAVSPDGTKLAFSGLRWSGDFEDAAGWYIYVCDLDGSNLRRVTPLEDEPVPPYVFPETGKTAFDVAREIALERMNADG